MDFLRLDPDATSQILSIRSEPAGAGFRHELTVQWKLTRLEWDFRFRPCPDPGRGPAHPLFERRLPGLRRGRTAPTSRTARLRYGARRRCPLTGMGCHGTGPGRCSSRLWR